MDRVALIAWCWFLVLIGLGAALGEVSGARGTGALLGFFAALFGTFAWPWIMPEALSAWMNRDRPQDSPSRRRI
jgi:hypothetical protein